MTTKVYKFYADWCAPCKALSTVLDSIDTETEIIPIDIDSEEGMEMSTKYGIRSIPMLVKLLDNGLTVTYNPSGKSKEDISKFING